MSCLKSDFRGVGIVSVRRSLARPCATPHYTKLYSQEAVLAHGTRKEYFPISSPASCRDQVNPSSSRYGNSGMRQSRKISQQA